MESNIKIEDYLKTRIKELNEADAAFCKDRWDMANPEMVRSIYREASNEAHARRRELESVLKFIESLNLQL